MQMEAEAEKTPLFTFYNTLVHLDDARTPSSAYIATTSRAAITIF
jgi:hypothetical protein